MKSSVIELINVPKDLVLEFVATFSRFEYALKRAGYVKADGRGGARVDWKSFGFGMSKLDAASLLSVLGCCEYLKEHPPKKQVVRKGQLDWDALKTEGSPIQDVLLSVRTVRNNLFHGGKFPVGPIEEPARDEQLIRDGLAVLGALLKLSTNQAINDFFGQS